MFFFHVNPSSGRRVVPDGRTDMTKLIVAFDNFANAPIKIVSLLNTDCSVVVVVTDCVLCEVRT